jgi:hypothetical protein
MKSHLGTLVRWFALAVLWAAPSWAQISPCGTPRPLYIVSDVRNCTCAYETNYCSGYNWSTSCGCPEPFSCCGTSRVKYGTMQCGSSCAGCDDTAKQGVKRAAVERGTRERPDAGQSRSGQKEGSAAKATNTQATEGGRRTPPKR